MEQILLPKETATAKMMLYKITKAIALSSDGDADFFEIVLQGDSLAPYLFIICLDYIIRKSIDLIKENDFTLKMARSRRYSAVTDRRR